MALHIEDAEIEMLAEELATRTGKSVPEAVRSALRAEAAAPPASGSSDKAGVGKLKEIAERCARLPDLDTRPADEIIGYNELGLPR